MIETGTLVLVRGKLERDEETARVLATEIVPLDTVRERLAREVAIRVKMPADRGVFEQLGEVFSRHRGDRRVSFEMELPSDPKRLRVQADVSLADPRAAVAGAGGRGRADRRRRASRVSCDDRLRDCECR